jgi:hypothetical protein
MKNKYYIIDVENVIEQPKPNEIRDTLHGSLVLKEMSNMEEIQTLHANYYYEYDPEMNSYEHFFKHIIKSDEKERIDFVKKWQNKECIFVVKEQDCIKIIGTLCSPLQFKRTTFKSDFDKRILNNDQKRVNMKGDDNIGFDTIQEFIFEVEFYQECKCSVPILPFNGEIKAIK